MTAMKRPLTGRNVVGWWRCVEWWL